VSSDNWTQGICEGRVTLQAMNFFTINLYRLRSKWGKTEGGGVPAGSYPGVFATRSPTGDITFVTNRVSILNRRWGSGTTAISA